MQMKSLLLLAALSPLAVLGGCATRSSVELAQASARDADSHAADARTRADAAQLRADQANQTGGDALALAQTDAQRADALEAQLKTANAKIAYLRNVVYKKVKHVKHAKRTKHRVRHAPAKPVPEL